MDICRGPIGIVACESGEPFAKKVFSYLKEIVKSEGSENGLRFIKSKEMLFANREIKTEIEESIRGCDIYIIQDCENNTKGMDVNDNLMALKTAIDAVSRCDASNITVIIPSYPYARQDKSKTREGVTAAMVAREIEDAGAKRVVTLDVHNNAIAGFFRKAKFEDLHASKKIIDYCQNVIGKDLVVSSADVGGVSRAEHYAQQMGTDLVIVWKKRDYTAASKVEKVTLLGNVNGKKVLVVDDMIATASTAEPVVTVIHSNNSSEIHFACSLPLLNGPAVQRLKELYEKGLLTSVIGTDAVYHGESFGNDNPWYKEVSVADYFAQAIYNINHGKSLSALLR